MIVHWHFLIEEDAVDEKWDDLEKGEESAVLEEWNRLVMEDVEEAKEHHLDPNVAAVKVLRSGDRRKIVVDGAHLFKHVSKLCKLRNLAVSVPAPWYLAYLPKVLVAVGACHHI